MMELTTIFANLSRNSLRLNKHYSSFNMLTAVPRSMSDTLQITGIGFGWPPYNLLLLVLTSRTHLQLLIAQLGRTPPQL